MAFSGEKYLKLWMDEAETLDKERLEAAKSPVKYPEPQKQKNSLFQPGAFHDGYQFGDVTKTLLGTGADVIEDLQKGVIGIGEGVVDTGAYLAGSVGGLFGADDFKDDMRDFVAKDLWDEEKIVKSGNLVDAAFGPGTTEENSLLGQKGDNIVASGGQLLGTAALQSVGVPWFVTSGLTSFGNSADNAFDQGATYGEAGASSLISAGAEILTEKLFGGSGLGEKGLIKLDKLTNGISNKLVKALVDYGLDMASEGSEEVVSQLASNLGSKLYREENLKEILFSEEAIDSYIDSFVAGSIMGGFSNASKFVNSAKSAVSDLRAPNKGNATPAPTTAENSPSGVSTSAQTPLDVDDLIDEAIARALNAPSDPVGAAVEGFKATGTITNNQARDILNSVRAVAQLIEQTGIKLPDTAAGRRTAVKEAVAQLAQKEATSPVDSIQNTDYDNKNATGGMNYAEGLHQNDRAGSPGDSARGMAGIQSGDGSGVEGWGQHGQVAVDSGILRVSDELSAAQQKRGTPVYDVQDTSATPERYEQALIAGRNSDTANGWCVTPKSAQELQDGNVRTFMNEGGTVGVGIASNGDIVAVFKNKDGGPPKAMDTMMPIAIEQGGDRLDCYGEGLVRVYARYGFIPVARVEFNAEYANEGWAPDKGTPYIYFMMHNGDSAANVADNIGKYPKYTKEQLEALPTYGKDDYDTAMAYRDSLMDQQAGGRSVDNAPAVSAGAAPVDFTGKSAYNDLLREGNVQPDRPGDVRPMEVPKTDPYGRYVSETAANLYGAKITPDEAASRIEELIAMGALGFDTKTNKQMLDEAAEAIKRDGVAASEKRVTKAVFSGKAQDADIVKAALLYTTYANRKGDAAQDKAAELAVDLATMANDAGRRLQLFKLIRKLTPQGQLLAVQKGIQRSVDRINEGRRQKNRMEVTIPQELVDEYLDAAQRDIREQTEETAQAKEEVERAIYKVAAAQIKASPVEKLNAWRYMAMLGNVKTQVRNIFGNAAFRPMASVKRAVGAVMEQAFVEQENRTKSILGTSQDAKVLLKWAQEDAKGEDVQQLLSYSGLTGDAAGDAIQDERQIFDTQWLETVRKTVQEVPEYFDMVFKGREYAYSLASFVKARGYTGADITVGNVPEDVLSAARSYAAQEALKATFNDHNAISNILSKRYRGDNAFGKALNLMAEGILPFRRTPANILVRAVEYSPANAVRFVWNLSTKVRTGDMSAATAIDQLASSLTGTAAMALGYALASGIFGIRLRGKIEDEDEKRTGHQQYAIEIGGQSYTIDWLAPSNIPLFIGANLYETGRQEGISWFSSAIDACGSSLEPMLELSCLSSLNDILQSAKYAEKGTELWSVMASAATSYMTQFIPTLFGQVEQATEAEKQTEYSSAATPVERSIEKTIGRMTQRIPGIDLFQTQRYDAWGNKVEASTSYQSFINPSYASDITNDPIDAEITRLNKVQGKNVSPSMPSQVITYTGTDGQTHKNQRLTVEQYETMCLVQGQTQKQLVEELIASADYAALSDTDKAQAIECAYDYARDTARIEAFGDYPGYSSGWMEQIDGNAAETILRHVAVGTTEKYTSLPVSVADYVDDLLKGLQKETKSDGSSYTSVRDIQKLEAVVSDDSLSKYVDDLLRDILQAGPEAKYDKALDAGYTPAQFVEGYRQYLDIEGKNKKQSIIRYCQREMGMSYAAAKKLCDIYYSKTTEE